MQQMGTLHFLSLKGTPPLLGELDNHLSLNLSPVGWGQPWYLPHRAAQGTRGLSVEAEYVVCMCGAVAVVGAGFARDLQHSL